MGGLYNLVNGFNPACLFFLPMLGRKESGYPRFRDCFLTDDEERIAIFTRVGGNNRGCGFGEEELMQDPLFVKTYDDDFDNTYGTYEFNVPEQWEADFRRIVQGKYSEVSPEYIQVVKEFYPKLAEAGMIDELFSIKGDSEKDG